MSNKTIFTATHTFVRESITVLIIKPTRCTNFSNKFLEKDSICFEQFLCPSSGVFHCIHSNGVCHTILLTVCEQDQNGSGFPSWSCSQAVSKPVWHIPLLCTVKNSWRWTEKLSETCRVLFQKFIWGISASSWFYYKDLSRSTVTWTSKKSITTSNKCVRKILCAETECRFILPYSSDTQVNLHH